MHKTKVAIIGTTGLPAKYGGFETLAHHLVDRLNQRYDLSVYCSAKYFDNKDKRRTTFNGAKLIYLPFNANGYQSIIYDIVSILHAIRKNDVLLILGVSGTLLLPFLKLFTKKNIIVNIDGQEWKRAKWNWLAKKFLGFSERLAIKYADKVIADNKVIYDYVNINYNKENVYLIEYGSDHVITKKSPAIQFEKYPFYNKNYAFNVCRIEPENQVHVLLETFALRPQDVLVVVGLWSHSKYAMDLKEQYSSCSNIYLLDPIYDQSELDCLRSNATIYVHGHSVGGTNPSLVEAMGLGLPVIAYDVSYNRETTEHAALYFKNSSSLNDCLNQLNQDKLKLISSNLKNIAERRYSWRRIAELYANAFDNNDYEYMSLLENEIANRNVEPITIKIPSTEKEAC